VAKKTTPKGRNSAAQSLERRIYGAYDRLGPGERRLAQTLLQAERELAAYSATELAQTAGVSKATAARLFRALGYASFKEARLASRELPNWGSPLATLAEDRKSEADHSFDSWVRAYAENMRMTADGLMRADLDACVRYLSKAPNVWVLGSRHGFALAHHAFVYFGFARSDVRFVHGDGGGLTDELASMRRGDVLFAVAFRRRQWRLIDIFEVVRELGVKIIFLTDPTAMNTARHADIVLRAWARSPASHQSFGASMAVIEYLAAQLSSSLGAAVRDRLRLRDRLLSRLDNVSQPAGGSHDPKRNSRCASSSSASRTPPLAYNT
jgi:DNA-binding MurR/RpiR family transcriptional regulator